VIGFGCLLTQGWLLCAEHFIVRNGVPEATILAHLGRFPSAQAASDWADGIRTTKDWFAASPSDRIAATEAFAALELRGHLCRIASLNESDPRVLPIVDSRQDVSGAMLHLGDPRDNRRASLAFRQLDPSRLAVQAGDSPEGFYIFTHADPAGAVVLIRGNQPIGTLYGTYAYLESLGVRWYSPNERDTILPRLLTIRVESLDWGEYPVIPYRQLYAHNQDRAFYLWMARNRLNGFAAPGEPVGFLRKIGMQFAVGQHSFLSDLIPANAPYPYHSPRFGGAAAKNRPADPYPVSPESRGDLDGDGSLSYYEARPEWFGLEEEGKRNLPNQPVYNVNYCTSNPSLLEELGKRLREALESGKWQDADIVEIWGFDAGKWCACSHCQRLGSPTDRSLLLVYWMQRALAQRKLDRPILLTTLAYQETIQPPSRPLPPDFDFDNIAVTFFPIRRCYFHKFNDPDCTELNRYYDLSLRAWTAPDSHYRGSMILGEYYNLSGFREFPVIFQNVMAEDIPYFAGRRLIGMNYMSCPGRRWGHRALTNSQFARQLWNPQAGLNGFWEEYFRLYYGPAAEIMRHYYAALERTVSNATAWRYDLWHKLHVVNRNPEIPLFPIGNIPPIPWYGKRNFPGSSDAGVDIFLGYPERPVIRDHLRYEVFRPARNDAPDWVEIMASLEQARAWLDKALRLELPDTIRSRIQEDEHLFRYGELSLRLYDHVIKMMLTSGTARQRAELAEAMRYAEQLSRYKLLDPPPSATDNGLIGVGLGPILDAYQKRLGMR